MNGTMINMADRPHASVGMSLLTENDVESVSGGLSAGVLYAGLGLLVLGGIAIAAAPAIGGLLAGGLVFGYDVSTLASVGIYASGLTLSSGGTTMVGMGLLDGSNGCQ